MNANWSRTRLRVVRGGLFASCFLVCALYAYLHGWWRFHSPSHAQFPVRGIDVSHHQGDIRWPEVAASGVRFAFVKATEGRDFRDPRCAANMREAQASGIATGAYLFFTLGASGEEQANFFSSVAPVSTATLPPVVDFELDLAKLSAEAQQRAVAELERCLETLKARFQVSPILYTTREIYDGYLTERPAARRIWLREIYWEPRLNDGNPWLFWQYANNGFVPGIGPRVDLNVFQGTEDSFQRLLRSRVTTTP